MSAAAAPAELSAEEDDQQREAAHFASVCQTFSAYKEHMMERLMRAHRSYMAIPARHRALLGSSFELRHDTLIAAIETNSGLITNMLMAADFMPAAAAPAENEENDESSSCCGPSSQHVVQQQHDARRRPQPTPDYEMEKVYTTLKQLVRDWSVEGQPERDSCYGVVMDVIDDLFASRTRSAISNSVSACDVSGGGDRDGGQDDSARLHYQHNSCRGDIRVLVPGAGLGRLPWELAARGYSAQGNEWSVHMLLASNFVLNNSTKPHCHTVYPWAHIFCNNFEARAQTRVVTLPDVDPTTLADATVTPGTGANLSMAAGDFLEVYGAGDDWDCVCTCFFLDTARNVVAYLEHIYAILAPGAYWVNFGPLLYHFSDSRDAPSLELSWEQVRIAALGIGFIVREERYPLPCPYIADLESMMSLVYNCVLFVAQKPLHAPAATS